MYASLADCSDKDFTEVWAMVVVECNKIAQWDLNTTSTVSIDEIVARLKRARDEKPDFSRDSKTSSEGRSGMRSEAWTGDRSSQQHCKSFLGPWWLN